MQGQGQGEEERRRGEGGQKESCLPQLQSAPADRHKTADTRLQLAVRAARKAGFIIILAINGFFGG